MGYDQVTHGGIVFSLLDDVMANWVWLQGERCFTAKADIRYRAELPVGTPVRLEGRCVKRKGRLAQMEGLLIRQADEVVVAEASGAFMVLLAQAAYLKKINANSGGCNGIRCDRECWRCFNLSTSALKLTRSRSL